MFRVLLIGAGAIGSRHLQALCRLSCERYEVMVLEPSDGNWEKAKLLWEKTVNVDASARPPSLRRIRTINSLPEATIDIAIVATQSDIRAKVVERLLSEREVESLILEKVLFQRLSEYERVTQILDSSGVRCWVNCPRRMWGGYQRLKTQFAGRSIKSLSVTGAGWDLGCNGIHFVDLFAFLTDASTVVIDGVRYENAPKPAKRDGVIHISGIVTGYLTRLDGSLVPISAESSDGQLGSKLIQAYFEDGRRLSIEEHSTKMRWSFEPEVPKSWQEDSIEFQSVLTDRAVRDIVERSSSMLTPYDDSRKHHMALLTIFCDTLGEFIPDIESGYCPVT